FEWRSWAEWSGPRMRGPKGGALCFGPGAATSGDGDKRHAQRNRRKKRQRTRCLLHTLAQRSEERLEQLGHFGRVARDLEAALFHNRQLGVSGVCTAADEGARVAHALARRSRHAGNEADHGLLHV